MAVRIRLKCRHRAYAPLTEELNKKFFLAITKGFISLSLWLLVSDRLKDVVRGSLTSESEPSHQCAKPLQSLCMIKGGYPIMQINGRLKVKDYTTKNFLPIRLSLNDMRYRVSGSQSKIKMRRQQFKICNQTKERSIERLHEAIMIHKSMREPKLSDNWIGKKNSQGVESKKSFTGQCVRWVLNRVVQVSGLCEFCPIGEYKILSKITLYWKLMF